MKKQLLLSLTILSLLFLGTTLVILYGRGYRFWFEKGKPDISGTGLLVTKSKPDGAQVFINDHLTTATDSTINLTPGEYTVKIIKDGYFPWEKKLQIQKEIVTKVDAMLFATAPKLESITTSGVKNPTIDPSHTRLAYIVASSSAKKNGVYSLDMATRTLLSLQGGSKQLIDDTVDKFSSAQLAWSPDGTEIIASASATTKNPTTYLLDSVQFNETPKDITNTLSAILAGWETTKKEKENAKLLTQKEAIQKIISENFSVVEWSPDETKILYIASQSANIPAVINPPLIGANQTHEERDIKKDALYVYDIKEDKNFKVSNAKGTYTWFFDSNHLVYTKDKKIHIQDYDGSNDVTIYAGPFQDNYVFPSPNASKIIILTDLGNPDISPNLYTLGLE